MLQTAIVKARPAVDGRAWGLGIVYIEYAGGMEILARFGNQSHKLTIGKGCGEPSEFRVAHS